MVHPNNSHLFPSRARSNSSPAPRPSSLSRLLAQASPEAPNQTIIESPPSTRPMILETLSTSPTEPLRKVSSTTTNNVNGHTAINGGNSSSSLSPANNTSSPLRPVSRASRLSTTSRFSVSRKPTLGIVAGAMPKAVATTALSEQIVAQSPTDSNNPFRSPLTSSPDESISEAMSTVIEDIGQRRRTVSFHPPRISSSSSQATVVLRPTSAASTTLANLANSLGMSFNRKKKSDLTVGMLTPPVESPIDASVSVERQVDGKADSSEHKSARDILKRF